MSKIEIAIGFILVFLALSLIVVGVIGTLQWDAEPGETECYDKQGHEIIDLKCKITDEDIQAERFGLLAVHVVLGIFIFMGGAVMIIAGRYNI